MHTTPIYPSTVVYFFCVLASYTHAFYSSLCFIVLVHILGQQGTQGYLQFLLPPVLKCLQDKDARVRYYACEALYNITKVARGSALIFFNEIFDGLCRVGIFLFRWQPLYFFSHYLLSTSVTCKGQVPLSFNIYRFSIQLLHTVHI